MRLNRTYFVIILAGAATVLTTPVNVAAQAVTGSNINRKEAGATGRYSSVAGQSARAGFNALSRCIAETFEVSARQALLFPFDEEQQNKSIAKITDRSGTRIEECYSADSIQASGSTISYAGAFAEFFLDHRFKDSDVDALVEDKNDAWLAARTKPRNAYERFGECVVNSSVDKVYALVSTVPDSLPETKAIAEVAKALPPCVLKDQQVSFDRTSLRSILAVALFRALDEHRIYGQGNAQILEAAE